MSYRQHSGLWTGRLHPRNLFRADAASWVGFILSSLNNGDHRLSKKSLTEVAGTVAYELFVPNYVKVINAAMTEAQGDMKSAEAKGIAELQLEAAKQKVVMDFQAHRAKVSQEVAIATRIATSNEVEITEYYDASGKGHAGLSANETSVTAGVGGEGRKITHRVIKFTGFSGSEPSDGTG